jgi:ubiquinone biosynthesis protein COQ9
MTEQNSLGGNSERDSSQGLDLEKTQILLAALPHVPFDGWTQMVIDAGVADTELDPDLVWRAFPGGPADLVKFFSKYIDRKMVAVLENTRLEDMQVRKRIAEAVRVRLDLLASHREAVRRMLAFLALPAHAVLGLSCLARTVDEMWHAAGDTSTDFNFYTKRGLLAGVYGTTLLAWLDDETEDFSATWAFLDRRIGDVMEIQKARGRLDKLVASFPNPLDVLHCFREGRPDKTARNREDRLGEPAA